MNAFAPTKLQFLHHHQSKISTIMQSDKIRAAGAYALVRTPTHIALGNATCKSYVVFVLSFVQFASIYVSRLPHIAGGRCCSLDFPIMICMGKLILKKKKNNPAAGL